jgi:type IV pilus assembly protein PilA
MTLSERTFEFILRQGEIMRKQKGFSLIELLIVVAIILIIAAIAIPNLLRARISANEASAVGSMRTIVTAEVSYQAANWSNGAVPVGFSTALADLGPNSGACATGGAATSTQTCLIDSVLSGATTNTSPKSGYFFTYAPVTNGGTNTGFTVNGDPATAGQTGSRYFFVDQSGVIRANPAGKASVSDNPIQ